ncbi:hypothetical protein [Actinacidiphila acididurans]|uniref:hypothetical protein n=1 Tax=Actinacidiphila acididurans TaxID=2784346 RepID=UPI0027DBDACA|nr:hypothetical protein [Actinacidiphila acididurans]
MNERLPGRWLVWEHPGEPGINGEQLAAALAQETGAPVLVGFVMDGDCVVIEAAGPVSGAWTACLGPRLMAGYLAEDGHLLEDWFLPPGQAASRSADWAREAGHTVDPAPLADLFRADVHPWAQDKFLGLLDAIGLRRA